MDKDELNEHLDELKRNKLINGIVKKTIQLNIDTPGEINRVKHIIKRVLQVNRNSTQRKYPTKVMSPVSTPRSIYTGYANSPGIGLQTGYANSPVIGLQTGYANSPVIGLQTGYANSPVIPHTEITIEIPYFTSTSIRAFNIFNSKYVSIEVDSIVRTYFEEICYLAAIMAVDSGTLDDVFNANSDHDDPADNNEDDNGESHLATNELLPADKRTRNDTPTWNTYTNVSSDIMDVTKGGRKKVKRIINGQYGGSDPNCIALLIWLLNNGIADYLHDFGKGRNGIFPSTIIAKNMAHAVLTSAEDFMSVNYEKYFSDGSASKSDILYKYYSSSPANFEELVKINFLLGNICGDIDDIYYFFNEKIYEPKCYPTVFCSESNFLTFWMFFFTY
jgi:ribosomal protein L29